MSIEGRHLRGNHLVKIGLRVQSELSRGGTRRKSRTRVDCALSLSCLIFQYLNLLIFRIVDDRVYFYLFWKRLYEYHEDKHKQAKHYSSPHYVVLPLEMLLFHFGKLQLSLYVDESQPYLFH